LLSAEYGWTDDYILDLTLERVLLARNMVRARQKHESRLQALLLETQTKYLVAAIHAAAGNKDAAKAAAGVSFFGKGDAAQPKVASFEKVMSMFPTY
jgi:hypothetical protein